MTTEVASRPAPDTTRAIASLTVGDAMHAGVLACPRDAPLTAVAQMMAEHRIHCVLTHPVDGRWAVVSDRDVAAAVASGQAATTTAGAAAATESVTVQRHEPLPRAAQLLHEHDVSHLVVVDAGEPAGVLSTLDLAAALARTA